MAFIHIVTADMFAGGAERVIAQLANYLVDNFHNVTIVTIYDSKLYYKLDRRVKLKSIGRKSTNKLLNKTLQYKEFRKIEKLNRPDLVLAMPEDIGIYCSLALIGTGIPIIVSERNNPWVMPDVKITRFLRRIAYYFSKGIVFQTEMAKSFFPVCIQKKSVVLSNPVDETRIPKVYEGVRRKEIVAVGRLAKQKNYPMLIKAFKIFSEKHDYKLAIYGDGDERRHIQNLINELKISDKIVLKGRRENVLEEIRDAAIFVMTSDYEGMPNALIEAMCMGMPVISTDCPSGGPRSLIKDKYNGILVSVGDANELASVMCDLIDNNKLGTLAENASRIRRQLTHKDVFLKWEEYIIQFCK